MKKSITTAPYLSAFCTELALILRSGFPVSEGLLMLRDEDNDRRSKALMGQLYEETDMGSSLSQALEKTGQFPRYMLDMVALGERTGRLEETMGALAEYYDRQAQMASAVRSAVAYPLILLVILLAVITVLITQVLPIFQSVFQQLGAEMSSFALGLMALGEGLSAASTVIAVVFGVILVAVLVCVLVPPVRSRLGGFLRRTFGGSGVWGRISVNRFTSAMAMAMASGLDLEESVDMAARIAGGARAIDERTARCREMILSGSRVGEALSKSGLFSTRNSRLLTLAESTGSLSDIMADIARRSEREVQDELDRIIGRVEPTLVILASVSVGVVLLSAMIPLLGIMSSIG